MRLAQFATLVDAPAPAPAPAPVPEPAPALKYQPEYDPANWKQGKEPEPEPAPTKVILSYGSTKIAEREIPPAPAPAPAPAPKAEPQEPVIPVDEIEPEISRSSDTDAVEAWARQSTSADVVEIIGAWVWLTYDSKPSRYELNVLKANGFRWARKRKQWCHPCGVSAKRGGSQHPRQRYGSIVVRDREDD